MEATRSVPPMHRTSSARSIMDGISMEELRGWALQMMEAYGIHSDDTEHDPAHGDASSMNELLRAARERETVVRKLSWIERLIENDAELTRLDLSYSLIKELSDDQKEDFLSALQHNDNIRIVHLSGLQILDCLTEEQVVRMMESLGNLEYLEELFMFRGGSHALTEELLAKLVDSARAMNVLMMWGYGKLNEHLELARVLRCHDGLQRITITLPKNRPYACMDVYAMAFAEMVNLRCLNLRGTSTQEEPVISPEAVRVLLGSRTIESLYLENLGLIDDHTDAICEELKDNKRLSLLDLKDNYFSDDALFTFAHILPHNKTLTSLDLSGVQITDRGGRAFVKGMSANTTLIHVELDGTFDKYADEFHVKPGHENKQWYQDLDFQLRLNRAGPLGNRKMFVSALNSVSSHLGCIYTLVRQSPYYCDLNYSPSRFSV